MLAEELCNESTRRTSEKKRAERGPNSSDDTQVSARARDIACAFLNFSDVDLDEFLSNADVQVYYCSLLNYL